MGGLGYLSGRLGGPGDSLGDVPKLPERVHSNLKIIEKALAFIVFRSIAVIRNLSGGPGPPPGGPREVLIVVELAQVDDLGGYFGFLQKTEKGQWPLTIRVPSR